MLTGQRNFSSVESLLWSVKISITWSYLQHLKQLKFQLVLWASSSHILLAQGHFLLDLVNDFIRGWLTLSLASLRANSWWCSGTGAGKWRRACNSSLEFEYLHRKSQCKMLIGGDDISNDIITLGACFSMFVYTCARFRSTLIGGNLTVQSTGSHRGIGGGIQISETLLQVLLPFPAPLPEYPGELARKLVFCWLGK